MQVEDGDVDEVEELRVVLDRVARGEEYDHLLLEVLLEEGEEEHEAVRRLAHDESLLEVRPGVGVGAGLGVRAGFGTSPCAP